MGRAKGTGTAAYQTSDGRWRAEVVLGRRPDGRALVKVVYGKTEKLANAARQRAINEHERGFLIAGRTPTLQEWTHHWLEEILPAQRRADSTIRGYKSKLTTWVWDTPLGGTRLDKLVPEHFDGLYKQMLDQERSANTVIGLHAVMRRALNMAVNRGRLGRNPLAKVEPPSAVKYEAQVLDLAEARRLLALAAEQLDAKSAFTLTIGPRQAERRGLDWADVNLSAGTVRFRRTMNWKPYQHGCPDPERCQGHRAAACPERVGGWTVGPMKSDRGARTWAMPQPLVEVMQAYRAQQLADRPEDWTPFFDSTGDGPFDLVFAQPNGRPMDSHLDDKLWHRFLSRAGAERVRGHDARHTAATVLLALGVDSRVVMDLMGWSQVSMLKRYQHVLDEMRSEVAAKVAGALWAPDPEPTTNVTSLSAWKRRKTSG